MNNLVHKVIVTCRLDTGDDIDVSISARGRHLSQKDIDILLSKMHKRFEPVKDSTLYYKIRQSNMGEKSNWNKISTYAEVEDIINREVL